MIRKNVIKEGRELKGLSVEEISLVTSPANRKSFLFFKGLGEGVGVGGERQGTGGAKYCVCPKCGEVIEHEKTGQGESIPCQKIKCTKCGTLMVGSNEKTLKGGEKKMKLEELKEGVLDLKKKVGEFSGEEPATEESLNLINEAFEKIEKGFKELESDDKEEILKSMKEYILLVDEFRKAITSPWKGILGTLLKEEDVSKVREGIKKLLSGEYGSGYGYFSPKKEEKTVDLATKEKELKEREEKIKSSEADINELTKNLKEISGKIITRDEIKEMINSAK